MRLVIAGTAPAALMVQRHFWRRQTLFTSLVVASGIVAYILAPYTYGSGDQWEWLSLAVQALAVWGFLLTARMLAQLEVETALAIEIETRAAEYLRDIKAQQRVRIDLDRLEETLLPNNPTDPPPAMIRLFQHICKEAKDRRFDSTVNLTQPYREEALEGVLRLQNLQKIALWLGILGTFVGMLIALQAGNLGDISGPDALLGVVQSMFDGLFVSFTASVAGLEVAVVLAFALQLLRARQEAYFIRMESATVTMLSAARHAINPDDFLAEFSQVTGAVRDLSAKVYEQTQEWSARLAAVNRRLEDHTVTVADGMTKLAAAKTEFEGFFKGVSDAQAAFIADVRGVYQAISLNQLGPALVQGVARAGDEVSTRFVAATAETAQQIKAVNESIERFRDVVNVQTQESAAAVKQLGAELIASSRESGRAIVAAGEKLQGEAGKFAGGTNGVSRELQQLATQVGELHRAISRLGVIVPPRTGAGNVLSDWRARLLGWKSRLWG